MAERAGADRAGRTRLHAVAATVAAGIFAAAALAAVALPLPAQAGQDTTGSVGEGGLAVPRHEAVYHASARGIPIRARLRLEAQGDGLYVYSFRAEPRGLFGFIKRGISETSLVMVGEDGAIVPLSYRKHDEFGGRDTDMRFDVGEGRVHVEYRGEMSVSDWEPGIYDLMSLRLVLAQDLARDALRETYSYIDDRSRIETVEVTVAGRETLSTPLGELETVRLAYRSERKDRRFTLWIAPEMDAALVRFEQHEDGKLRGSLEIVEYQRL